MHRLNVQSVHATLGVYGHLRFPTSCCERPSYWSGRSPDYDAALREFGRDNVLELVRASGVTAFSDEPWPLLWPYLASELPRAKFVLWQRNSTR